jgi:adenylate cyclase
MQMEPMDESQFSQLAAWITEVGLVGGSETTMLTGFCERAVACGLPLAGGVVVIDTLHPLHEGHAIRWYNDKEETRFIEYGRTNEGEAAENYRRSTFYHLFSSGEPILRRRFTAETIAEFPSLAPSLERGMTDYLGLMYKFAAEGIIGDMDCVFSGWETDRPGGFAEEHVAALQRLMPFLAIAMKCTSLGRIAQTLSETYLGRDAGRLVLSGRIARGVADRIETVLWFSDLRGYTKITDTAPPEQIIPLLNDYAEAVIPAVHAQGGDVLKLMGDGVLAIFRADDRKQACRSAIIAATAAGESVAALNRRRAAEGLATTQIYLGLHIGEVFFGNIGSPDRLDFTVVGPAVNEVSRIAAMCRSVDQPVLVSAAFAAALGDKGRLLVSVGRYALRGVRQPQELFTVDPDPNAAPWIVGS